MDSTLLIVLTVFVALSALSQLGQAIALMGLRRRMEVLTEEARPLFSKAEQTLDSARQTLEESRKQITEISQRTNQILDSTQAQLDKIDAVVTEASDRARVQLERVEMVVGDTVDKVQGLVTTTQQGLMKPLREVTALASGVKSAFGFLFKPRRSSVEHATQDEEMFI